ncbi:MAG: alginate lyase family protein [Nitrosospira sp.]
MTPLALREKILWRVNRLRCMSPAEVAYRFQQSVRMHLQRRGFFVAPRTLTADARNDLPPWIAKPPVLAPEAYITAATSITSGYLDVFALHGASIGYPPRWNCDPGSGVEFPLTFGPQLNYRNLEDGADIKFVWEPNRHLQLVTLAQAYALTGSDTYLQALRLQMESWLDQCPYLLGPNWSSSLEAAIRLINWSIVWQLVGGSRSQLFDGRAGIALHDRWLTSIYQHMHFIRHGFSRHSSANNHLIGEAAGLFVATRTWLYWKNGRAWGDLAQNILDREALLQNAPDGGNREQAFAYQQFVLNFLLIAGLAARVSGPDFSMEYWKRISVMIEFIASIMDVGGNVPMVGDADDGLAIRLSQEPDWCPFRSLLATGAVLFRRSDFRAKAGRLDEQTLWLLGDEAYETFDELKPDPVGLPVRRSYPESGYYILGDRFETPEEIRIIADAGSLGYLSIAAHGHADALSVTLSVGGKEFLVDPGTYAYNAERRWRDYFRGTAAHNTVRLDGMDQSEIGGSFLWLRKAQAHCERWSPGETRDELAASHDGYQRLEDPVIHRRTLSFDKCLRQMLVTDEIECEAKHTVEICWNFAEQCDICILDENVVAIREGFCVTLQLVTGISKLQLFQGNEDRPAGWVSRHFGVKVPAPTAIWFAEVSGNSRFTTLVSIKKSEDHPRA